MRFKKEHPEFRFCSLSLVLRKVNVKTFFDGV